MKKTRPDSHSYISASNASIWCPAEGEGCTAMGWLYKKLVDEQIFDFSRNQETEEEWQRRGTQIHELGADYIQALFLKEEISTSEPMTEEEQVALDYASWVYDTFHVMGNKQVEMKIWLTKEIGGTGDLSCYDDLKRTLHIVDLKTGYVPVFPEQNEQLMFYAACQVEEYPEVEFVTLHIYQPSDDDEIPAASSWTCAVEEIREYKEKLLKTIDKIERGEVRYRPGSRCGNCKALAFCDAQGKQFIKALNVIQ